MKVIGNVIQADEGKTFKRKTDGVLLGASLTLGAKDSPDNYEEMDFEPPFEGTREDEMEAALRLLGVKL